MTNKASDADQNIPPGSAASLAAAIAQDRTKDDPVQSSRAEVFLDEQTKLIRLQTEQLNEQRRLLLGSLRFRHVGEVLSVTLQIMFGVLALAVVIVVGATVWSAAHDNALVVEAFDVPPDIAAKGLTGKVVASQLLDHLSSLQDSTNTARAAASYKNDWGNDIKVQIPNTGISVGEFYRYLCDWLGHETHISGEIYRTASGVALIVRSSGSAGGPYNGAEADLPKLLGQAAEYVYARTQPYRYAIYLQNKKDTKKSDEILYSMLANSPDADVKWAYVGLGNSATIRADYAGAAEMAQKAIKRDSTFAQAYFLLSLVDSGRGHDEEALDATNGGMMAIAKGRNENLDQRAKNVITPSLRAQHDEFLGDFASALRENDVASNLPDYNGKVAEAEMARIVDLERLHEIPEAEAALRVVPPNANLVAISRATLILATLVGDRAAVDAAFGAKMDVFREFMVPTAPADDPLRTLIISQCVLQPLAVMAALHSNAIAEAQARATEMPDDCYLALRVHGQLAAALRDWNGAAHWFDMAINQSPSIPFAYADYGAMLLAKGDLDGAMTQLSKAHERGPHFADPLEMWGEALIAKNRSDLALAKFEEANQYAPRWGRLHLKWGEALGYVGRDREAAEQFAACSGLFLTSSERMELTGAGRQRVRAH